MIITIIISANYYETKQEEKRNCSLIPLLPNEQKIAVQSSWIALKIFTWDPTHLDPLMNET